MKTYIHGTSYESAMSIIKDGLIIKSKELVWKCSNNGLLYCRDADDEEENALCLCIESGQIAAAKANSLSTKIGIVKLEIPDELAKDIVADDSSCDNMYGCYEINIEEINKNIVSGEIRLSIDIHADAYIPYLRPFYLANLSMEFIKIDDPLLIQAIDVVNKCSASVFYFEELCSHGNIEASYEVTNELGIAQTLCCYQDGKDGTHGIKDI